MWKETAITFSKLLFHHLPGEAGENIKSVMVAGVWAEIQIQDLPNKKLEL
jgi:hypothetical protein